MKDLRESLGGVFSRNLANLHHTNIFPGTVNKYVEAQFNTSFLNMAYAVEILTLICEDENRWRIWKYEIKDVR